LTDTKALAKCAWSAWSKLVPVIVAVSCLALIVVLVANGHVPSAGLVNEAHERDPYEYLYLDSARVDSYLGQLKDGNVKTVERSEGHTDSAGFELQAANIGKATASTESERKQSAVVTLTEADNFYDLFRELDAEESLTPVDLEAADVNAGEPRKILESVSDGTMVVLKDVFIRVPPYLSVYPALRYAVPALASGRKGAKETFGAPPLTRFGASEVAINAQVRHDRELFIKRVGQNPRLPLIVSTKGMTIFLPARFANITGDISLFGTRLTIVGKVVFKGHQFGDGASVAAYLPALLKTSGRLLRDLGVRSGFVKRYELYRHAHKAGKVREMQTRIFEALERSLSFGPTVEVVPVAIYD
jgi:hypothetical protein